VSEYQPDDQARRANGREFIIPYGACVGEERELFAQIDAGAAQQDRSLLSEAEEACLNCLQLPVCNPYSREIAGMLGYGAFIAGKQVAAEVLADDRGDRLDIVALPFDLRELPFDPHLALTHLRRGVRSGQFYIDGPRPTELPRIGEHIMEKLADRTPQIFEDMSDRQLIKITDAQRAVESIALVLCQQADFVRFTTTKGNPTKARASRENRYSPEHFKLEDNFPIICEYLEDVIELARNGFLRPAKQGLSRSAAEWKQLATLHLDGDMSNSEFHDMVRRSWREPERVLKRYKTMLHANRLLHPGGSEASLRMAARLNKLVDPAVEKALEERFVGSTPIRRGMIRKTVNAVADPEAVFRAITERVEASIARYGADHPYLRVADMLDIATGNTDNYADALERFINNMRLLVDFIGARPGITPGTLRRIAKHRPNDPLVAAQEFLDKITAEDTEGRAMRRRSIKTNGSPEEIELAYRIAKANGRFAGRVAGGAAGKLLERWEVRRVAACYPLEMFDEVAEQVFACVNQGVLTSALGAPSVLQDLNFQAHVNSIRDPVNGRYITFAIPLEPFERLALASHYGLDLLLYGATIDRQRLASALGVEDWGRYIQEGLLSKVEALTSRSSEESPHIPPTLSLLSEDMLLLRHVTKDDELSEPARPRGFSTVVGAEIIDVAPEDLASLHELDAPTTHWLQKKIIARYRADAEDASVRVSEALANGILELSGGGAERTISFSKSIRSTATEYERATLASRLGIDRLLYGNNIGSVLLAYKGLLGESNIVDSLSPLSPPEPRAVRAYAEDWDDFPEDSSSAAAAGGKSGNAGTDSSLVTSLPEDNTSHKTHGEQSALAAGQESAVKELGDVLLNQAMPPVTPALVRPIDRISHAGWLTQEAKENWETLVASQPKRRITHQISKPFKIEYELPDGTPQTIVIPPKTELSIFFRTPWGSERKAVNTLGTFFLREYQVSVMSNGNVRVVRHKAVAE